MPFVADVAPGGQEVRQRSNGVAAEEPYFKEHDDDVGVEDPCGAYLIAELDEDSGLALVLGVSRVGDVRTPRDSSGMQKTGSSDVGELLLQRLQASGRLIATDAGR